MLMLPPISMLRHCISHLYAASTFVHHKHQSPGF
jgi:hypothetical protein